MKINRIPNTMMTFEDYAKENTTVNNLDLEHVHV